MKPTYIVVVALVLIVIGILWYNMGDRAEITPPLGNSNSTPTTTDDMNINDEEHAEMNETPGTDVGMEMPETNVDGSINVDIDSNAKVFNVSGANFTFDTKEIRVKRGDTVVINFKSSGGFHDWVLDEFNAKTSQVQTGQTSSVTFVADRTGTFEYYCSVGTHRQQGMVGKLIVE